MSKSIRISDECYDKIKNLANKNYRSIVGQIEFLIDTTAALNHAEDDPDFPIGVDYE